ncbi:MAG: Gfo/Idh/MocA family oxidoreductase, partial [Bacteroidota bacterium]
AGLLFDLGPHLIDQALVRFGLPLRIDARVEAQREGAVVDDFFHLVLEYPEMLVVLSAGSLVRRAGPRLRLDGSLGTYVKHHPDPQEAALRAGLHQNSAGFGEEDPTHYGRITYGIDGLEYDGALKTLPGSYVSFYEMLARAVRGEGPPPVCPEEARAVMAVLEAARQSARRTSRIEMPDFT